MYSRSKCRVHWNTRRALGLSWIVSLFLLVLAKFMEINPLFWTFCAPAIPDHYYNVLITGFVFRSGDRLNKNMCNYWFWLINLFSFFFFNMRCSCSISVKRLYCLWIVFIAISTSDVDLYYCHAEEMTPISKDITSWGRPKKGATLEYTLSL